MAPHEINENPTTNIYTQIEKESTLMFLSTNVVCMLFQYSIQTKSQKKILRRIIIMKILPHWFFIYSHDKYKAKNCRKEDRRKKKQQQKTTTNKKKSYEGDNCHHRLNYGFFVSYFSFFLCFFF